jgi:hypothetical protein
MTKFLLMMVMVVTMPIATMAQTGSVLSNAGERSLQSSFLKSGKKTKFSLLDPAKMSMSHQYSMLFASGNGGPGATGVYQNTIAYEFSPAMLLRVNLGVVHQLTSSSSSQTGQAGNRASRIVPGFDFTYRPTENMILQVSYGIQQRGYNNRFLATDQTWFSGANTTSRFFRPASEAESYVHP